LFELAPLPPKITEANRLHQMQTRLFEQHNAVEQALKHQLLAGSGSGNGSGGAIIEEPKSNVGPTDGAISAGAAVGIALAALVVVLCAFRVPKPTARPRILRPQGRRPPARGAH
jgi:hypothetical protein